MWRKSQHSLYLSVWILSSSPMRAGLHLIKSFNLDHLAPPHFLQHSIWATPQLPKQFSSRTPNCNHKGRERGAERDLHPEHLFSLPAAMEREVRFCPKWHSALWFLLLVIFSIFHAAKPEITCRSCQPGSKWRAQELLLKFDKSEFATGFTSQVFENGDGAGRADPAGAESRRLSCAAGSAGCLRNRAEYTQPRLKRNTDSFRSKEGTSVGEGEFALRKMKVSDAKMSGQHKTGVGRARPGLASAIRYKKRTRRNSGDRGDNKATSPDYTKSEDPGEGITSPAGRRVTRSELRWSGEDRRAAASRQEELKLASSTFALTGDSAHNQAMVHWSGQNSSVSHLSAR